MPKKGTQRNRHKANKKRKNKHKNKKRQQQKESSPLSRLPGSEPDQGPLLSEQEEEEDTKNLVLRTQIFGVFSACTGALTNGLMLAFSAGIIPELESGEGDFTITREQGSWIRKRSSSPKPPNKTL